eukprot:Rmarinus@m.12009
MVLSSLQLPSGRHRQNRASRKNPRPYSSLEARPTHNATSSPFRPNTTLGYPADHYEAESGIAPRALRGAARTLSPLRAPPQPPTRVWGRSSYLASQAEADPRDLLPEIMPYTSVPTKLRRTRHDSYPSRKPTRSAFGALLGGGLSIEDLAAVWGDPTPQTRSPSVRKPQRTDRAQHALHSNDPNMLHNTSGSRTHVFSPAQNRRAFEAEDSGYMADAGSSTAVSAQPSFGSVLTATPSEGLLPEASLSFQPPLRRNVHSNDQKNRKPLKHVRVLEPGQESNVLRSSGAAQEVTSASSIGDTDFQPQLAMSVAQSAVTHTEVSSTAPSNQAILTGQHTGPGAAAYGPAYGAVTQGPGARQTGSVATAPPAVSSVLSSEMLPVPSTQQVEVKPTIVMSDSAPIKPRVIPFLRRPKFQKTTIPPKEMMRKLKAKEATREAERRASFARAQAESSATQKEDCSDSEEGEGDEKEPEAVQQLREEMDRPGSAYRPDLKEGELPPWLGGSDDEAEGGDEICTPRSHVSVVSLDEALLAPLPPDSDEENEKDKNETSDGAADSDGGSESGPASVSSLHCSEDEGPNRRGDVRSVPGTPRTARSINSARSASSFHDAPEDDSQDILDAEMEALRLEEEAKLAAEQLRKQRRKEKMEELRKQAILRRYTVRRQFRVAVGLIIDYVREQTEMAYQLLSSCFTAMREEAHKNQARMSLLGFAFHIWRRMARRYVTRKNKAFLLRDVYYTSILLRRIRVWRSVAKYWGERRKISENHLRTVRIRMLRNVLHAWVTQSRTGIRRRNLAIKWWRKHLMIRRDAAFRGWRVYARCRTYCRTRARQQYYLPDVALAPLHRLTGRWTHDKGALLAKYRWKDQYTRRALKFLLRRWGKMVLQMFRFHTWLVKVRREAERRCLKKFTKRFFAAWRFASMRRFAKFMISLRDICKQDAASGYISSKRVPDISALVSGAVEIAESLVELTTMMEWVVQLCRLRMVTGMIQQKSDDEKKKEAMERKMEWTALKEAKKKSVRADHSNRIDMFRMSRERYRVIAKHLRESAFGLKKNERRFVKLNRALAATAAEIAMEEDYCKQIMEEAESNTRHQKVVLNQAARAYGRGVLTRAFALMEKVIDALDEQWRYRRMHNCFRVLLRPVLKRKSKHLAMKNLLRRMTRRFSRFLRIRSLIDVYYRLRMSWITYRRWLSHIQYVYTYQTRGLTAQIIRRQRLLVRFSRDLVKGRSEAAARSVFHRWMEYTQLRILFRNLSTLVRAHYHCSLLSRSFKGLQLGLKSRYQPPSDTYAFRRIAMDIDTWQRLIASKRLLESERMRKINRYIVHKTKLRARKEPVLRHLVLRHQKHVRLRIRVEQRVLLKELQSRGLNLLCIPEVLRMRAGHVMEALSRAYKFACSLDRSWLVQRRICLQNMRIQFSIYKWFFEATAFRLLRVDAVTVKDPIRGMGKLEEWSSLVDLFQGKSVCQSPERLFKSPDWCIGGAEGGGRVESDAERRSREVVVNHSPTRLRPPVVGGNRPEPESIMAEVVYKDTESLRLQATGILDCGGAYYDEDADVSLNDLPPMDTSPEFVLHLATMIKIAVDLIDEHKPRKEATHTEAIAVVKASMRPPSATQKSPDSNKRRAPFIKSPAMTNRTPPRYAPRGMGSPAKTLVASDNASVGGGEVLLGVDADAIPRGLQSDTDSEWLEADEQGGVSRGWAGSPIGSHLESPSSPSLEKVAVF